MTVLDLKNRMIQVNVYLKVTRENGKYIQELLDNTKMTHIRIIVVSEK